MKTISITTGDRKSIGLEITTKALLRLPQRIKDDACIFTWRSSDSDDCYFNKLKNKFIYKKVTSLAKGIEAKKQGFSLIDIKSSQAEYNWVENSVRGALKGIFTAIVTGPVGKNKKYKGHTDLLRKLTKKEAFMCFVGSKFSTLLVTDHIPIKDVANNITLSKLKKAIHYSNELLKIVNAKDIVLLGLNPHAGEGGVIGSEEVRVYKSAVKYAKARGIPITGPVSADVAFKPGGFSRKVFIANYHDQGLIPFKSLHRPYTTINLTLGLSFIRTSCDHGMAIDIAGKNVADDGSMYRAIKYALQH